MSEKRLPPPGFDSWDEYYEHNKRSVERILEQIKQSLQKDISDQLKPEPGGEKLLSKIQLGYQNQCWRCKGPIDSSRDKHCERCSYYKCSACGACFCDKPRVEISDANLPF